MTMSEQATAAAKLQPNQAVIVGRIDSVRSFDASGNRVFETRVIQPAVDSFSSPTAVAIQSRARIGQKDEDVKVLVHVSGYKDSYKSKPDADGVVTHVQTARNVLRAVE
jgi:hypothetical protein